MLHLMQIGGPEVLFRIFGPEMVAACCRSVSSTTWSNHPSTSEFSVERELLRKNRFVSLECSVFLPGDWIDTFWSSWWIAKWKSSRKRWAWSVVSGMSNRRSTGPQRDPGGAKAQTLHYMEGQVAWGYIWWRLPRSWKLLASVISTFTSYICALID